MFNTTNSLLASLKFASNISAEWIPIALFQQNTGLKLYEYQDAHPRYINIDGISKFVLVNAQARDSGIYRCMSYDYRMEETIHDVYLQVGGNICSFNDCAYSSLKLKHKFSFL